jgi:hypothetical protein
MLASYMTKRHDKTHTLLKHSPHERFEIPECFLAFVDRDMADGIPTMRYKSEGRGFDSRWCH